MNTSVQQLILRKLVSVIALLLGTSLIGFVLMVGFAPDGTYELLGKSATPQQIAELRHSLGYDDPLPLRYLDYLRQIVSLDFGYSASSGEPVSELLMRCVPVTLMAVLPGFLLGHLIALIGAFLCARWVYGPIDRLLETLASIGMSLSLVVLVIGGQALLSSTDGLDWFPVRGWDASSIESYLHYVAVPTATLAFAGAVYNLRFYRALMVAELEQPYTRTARSFGAGPSAVLLREVMPNLRIALITRIVFSLPLLVVSGSLVIESYFGIPGVGAAAFNAVTAGDQAVTKALVSLGAVLFAITLGLADGLYRSADPRLELR